MPIPGAVIGRPRNKKTAWTVRAGDVLSRWIITIGGIGTLIAVSTVFLYLLWVVAPLLKPSRLWDPLILTLEKTGAPLHLAMDEYQRMAWRYEPNNRLVVFDVHNGATLAQPELTLGETVTAAYFSHGGTESVLGLADGSIILADFGFATDFASETDAPEAVRTLKVGEHGQSDGRIWTRLPSGQLRSQRFVFHMDAPIPAETTSRVLRVARVERAGATYVASLHANGEAYVWRLTRRRNLLMGKETVARTSRRVPLRPHAADLPPVFLGLSGLADTLILLFEDGLLERYDLRDFEQPVFIDETRTLESPDRRVTACRYLLGRSTLLMGDSHGRVRAWFPVNVAPQGDGTRSRTRLVAAQTLEGRPHAVTALATSQRIRMCAAGYADGTVRLFHVTSGKKLGEIHPVDENKAVSAIAISPKDDGLAFMVGDRLVRWRLDVRHPEATLKSLFAPVWYEGASRPAHVWQSSSGTDDFEPKFGLVPLIFGTLKATVYSLIFGVPIALLAAIFTSEFLSPQARTVIKPLVEMMSSLPSVVLGFLAALVFAPLVAGILPAVLAAFVFIPGFFLLGAYLWQLIPYRMSLGLQRWRLIFVGLTVPLALRVASTAGPLLERVCFAGDIMRWLDGQVGGAAGGWAVFLYPLAVGLTAWGFRLTVSRWIRHRSRSWSRTRCAVVDALAFVAAALLTVPVTMALGHGLAWAGLDPRGPMVGTYVQRNALVVGFMMGFAIIPIIYTLAEDALTAVPDHLRSASLAAGATPWQTAIRIVIPTAMSGLFSAVMIGLGRAVGETMIVLMAAGNTPVMSWNPFDGFRTLSANIAVELPEAVRNSTHYRTLFLAALVLFVMTFVLNTLAELVRSRYRRKAIEL
jgi:phosphate transport system permease protein